MLNETKRALSMWLDLDLLGMVVSVWHLPGFVGSDGRVVIVWLLCQDVVVARLV